MIVIVIIAILAVIAIPNLLMYLDRDDSSDVKIEYEDQSEPEKAEPEVAEETQGGSKL